MIKLSQWDKALPISDVARRSFETDGVKFANYEGYILVVDTPRFYTTYFRATRPIQALYRGNMSWCYPTGGLLGDGESDFQRIERKAKEKLNTDLQRKYN